MNKRGQIYLLVALVMSIVIFGLVTISNRAEQESVKSDFEKLSNNYATESSRLVNSLLENPSQDVGEAFNDFSLLFTTYAKTQSPDFGLIYAFNYGGKLYIGNYLKEGITVDWGDGPNETSGCYAVIPASVGFEGISAKVDIKVIKALKSACTLEKEFPGGVPESIFLTLGDETVPYTFTMKRDQPEVIMVSWESRGEQRKVYTEGDLQEGGA